MTEDLQSLMESFSLEVDLTVASAASWWHILLSERSFRNVQFSSEPMFRISFSLLLADQANHTTLCTYIVFSSSLIVVPLHVLYFFTG